MVRTRIVSALITSTCLFVGAVVANPVSADSLVSASASKKSAKSCFNSRLLDQGTTFETRYQYTDAFSKNKTVSDISQVVIGIEKFNGKKALMSEAETTIVQNGVTGVTKGASYITVHKSKERFTNLGGLGEGFVDGVSNGTVKTTFTPGQTIRFDLFEGQSYKENLTLKSVSKTSAGKSTSTSKQKVRTKFIGMEKVSVPAGKFNACKFKVTMTITQLGFSTKITRTVWYAAKTGIQLKDETKQVGSSVLLSAKIDGVEI